MLVKRIRNSIDEKFEKWLRRRIPASSSITLSQKRVFIFPSKAGFFFGGTLAASFVGGINYANSLILALTFFLSSVFVVSILHTFRNLSGLTIASGTVEPCFAGESAVFYVELCRHGSRTYEGIHLFWEGGAEGRADLVDLTEVSVPMFLPANQRGLFRPGRLRIETKFPVGLLRAWSWIDLDVSCYIYPKPVKNEYITNDGVGVDEGPVTNPNGSDDFVGHQQYQPGDSLNHVDWKILARGQPLYTKSFVSHGDDETWLDWANYPGLDVEMRLSYLCFWVLRLSEKNKVFGLRIPGNPIGPNCGNVHKMQCLQMLATYNTRINSQTHTNSQTVDKT